MIMKELPSGSSKNKKNGGLERERGSWSRKEETCMYEFIHVDPGSMYMPLPEIGFTEI